MKMKGKREGKQRIELKKKRSGRCESEFKYYKKACEEIARNMNKELEDFKDMVERNAEMRMKNVQDPGRLFLRKAAELETVGDHHEEGDLEEGEASLRATLVQKVVTKTFLVDQGKDTMPGKQIMREFSKTTMKIPRKK